MCIPIRFVFTARGATPCMRPLPPVFGSGIHRVPGHAHRKNPRAALTLYIPMASRSEPSDTRVSLRLGPPPCRTHGSDGRAAHAVKACGKRGWTQASAGLSFAFANPSGAAECRSSRSRCGPIWCRIEAVASARCDSSARWVTPCVADNKTDSQSQSRQKRRRTTHRPAERARPAGRSSSRDGAQGPGARVKPLTLGI